MAVSKKVTAKAKKLKVGQSLKLSAKAKKAKGASLKRIVKMRYESTNPDVATVSAGGVVRAKAKGSCYVYAYAQNGVAKRVRVTVK